MNFRSTKELCVVDIENINFTYHKEKVLDDINLKIYENDFLAIIGPNGGGKSTLLKLILGLEKYKKGSIKILNKKISNEISKIG